jgi:CcmD family protein
MGALVAAYLAVWLGVSLYVAWLDVGQRRLRDRLDALASQIAPRSSMESRAAKAA